MLSSMGWAELHRGSTGLDVRKAKFEQARLAPPKRAGVEGANGMVALEQAILY
jgi:hypothetical protein